jgi:cell division protein FtsX
MMIRFYKLLKGNMLNSLKNLTVFLIITYFSFILSSFIFLIYKELNSQISQIPITLSFNKNEDAYHAENLILNKKNYYKIDSISFITSETGMYEFQQQYGNISSELLPNNPLPAIIQIYLNSDEIDNNNLNYISKDFKKIADVDKILFPIENITYLLTLRKFFQIIIIILGIALLMINIFIISMGTAKILQSGREEYKLMKRMGSSKIFTIFPALFYNIVTGFLGILLGILSAFITIYFLQGFSVFDIRLVTDILMITAFSILLIKLIINIIILVFYRIE